MFIEKGALEALYDFLEHDLNREHGGVFVGKPYYDPKRNCYYTLITSTIPALYTQGNPVHLQFTPKSWEYISNVIEENFPEKVIVGWHHSHPGLGVFMSGTDRATQQAFYFHDWNVAVVVDPIHRKTGWFSGAECIPMRQNQVVVIEHAIEEVAILQTVEDIPKEVHTTNGDIYTDQRYTMKNLRWLLPFSTLLLILVLLVWFYGKERT